MQHKHSRRTFSTSSACEKKHIMKILECVVSYQPILISSVTSPREHHTAHSPYHTFPIDENCFYVHITFPLHHFRFSFFSPRFSKKFIVFILLVVVPCRKILLSVLLLHDAVEVHTKARGRRKNGKIEVRFIAFIIILIAFENR